MSDERLFLDTVFIQALLNKRDQYYVQARVFLPRMRVAASVWVTEAVLVEVGNALSAVNRPAAVQFIQQCYNTANLQVPIKIVDVSGYSSHNSISLIVYLRVRYKVVLK